MYLKEEARDYLEPETIKDLVRKYSQFINFNIYFWTSKTEEVEEPIEEEEAKEEEKKEEGGEDKKDEGTEDKKDEEGEDKKEEDKDKEDKDDDDDAQVEEESEEKEKKPKTKKVIKYKLYINKLVDANIRGGHSPHS